LGVERHPASVLSGQCRRENEVRCHDGRGALQVDSGRAPRGADWIRVEMAFCPRNVYWFLPLRRWFLFVRRIWRGFREPRIAKVVL